MGATVSDVYRNGKWLQAVGIRGQHHHTESGVKWSNIDSRCKNHSYYQGCRNNFKDFDSFVEWHRKQVGYGRGWVIDKDILVEGNKIYSEETCVLVPQEINKLVLRRQNDRGLYPIGVVKVGRKFRSQLAAAFANGSRHLGYFDTPQEAFSAYKEAKENLIFEVAKQWKDEIDERVYDALINYEVQITD